MDKAARHVRVELESRPTHSDLANVQATLLERINELMSNLDNMFADKDATRKKLLALEKAVK